MSKLSHIFYQQWKAENGALCQLNTTLACICQMKNADLASSYHVFQFSFLRVRVLFHEIG
jgi:hypothetical protein